MFRRKQSDQFSSSLYDQNTFFEAFLRDIRSCQKQLIIESPFITSKRANMFLPIFRSLRKNGMQVIINTRNPDEHEDIYREQAADAVASFQALGILVLYTGGHHRKLAIIDGAIVWEGSLNILSYSDSCEIMRRIASEAEATLLFRFTKLDIFIGAAS